MDQAFFDQLERWHQEDQFQRIIDAVEAIPEEERGYELTALLARAYENRAGGRARKPYETAVRLLLSIREEGEADPNWHFRMGFALYHLDREAEAADCFRRVLELIPGDPETQAFWSDCRELLAKCEAAVRRREAEDAYGDGDALDPGTAQNYLLHAALHGQLEAEDRVEGDHLVIPRWNLTITPRVEQLTERGTMLNFYLSAPQWGKDLFECSVGMGAGPKQSMGMAVGSFLFSFMEGVARMERGENPRTLTSSFAGNTHRWKVYLSNVVGMGQSPQLESSGVYWEALREEIAKRLGNQKLCYVKIYGAKVNGEVTGECRVDDIKSGELSAKVAEMVARWDVEQFASHKQFFFLRQEEETTLPSPYLGREGFQRLKAGVVEAARMFHACRTEEDCDALCDRLAEALGDYTLAAECAVFLPELCAENAFPQLSYAETVDILREGRPAERLYKNQLADFYPLWAALSEAFREGVFGEETDSIYREYVGYSSIYNVIQKMREDGSRLEDCRLTSLLFRVGEEFQLR